MCEALIIGLPTKVRQRVEITLNRNGARVTSILATLRNDRTFQLLPHPSQAVHVVRGYIDRFDDLSDVSIVVLPYARVPDDLKSELDAIEQLGGSVAAPFSGIDRWPKFRKRKKGDSDHIFERELHDRLVELLCPTKPADSPSDYFDRLRQDHVRLLIPDRILETCDLVAPLRYDFMRGCADSFVEMLQQAGSVGDLGEFFSGRGLVLAQSGGISTTVRVVRDGNLLLEETSKVHLKQGDGTTPQSAARIYFQHFSIDREFYVAITYAGPHPDTNATCELVLD